MQPSWLNFLYRVFIRALKFYLILIFLLCKGVHKRVRIYCNISPFRLTLNFWGWFLLRKWLLATFKIGIQIQRKICLLFTKEIYLSVDWGMVLICSERSFQRFQAAPLVWNDCISNLIMNRLRNSNFFFLKL